MAKILSIEDDAELQQLIGRVLFQEGYEMYYAWNGREGYSKVLELKPDLLLLDLMLPQMNGLDLMKELRANKRTVTLPILVVTAFGDEANMLKLAVEQLGAVGYIRKPVQLSDLVGVVRRTLAGLPRGEDSGAAAPELRRGCVRADPVMSSVWVNDKLVATLANKEFELLRCLLESRGPAKKAVLFRALGYESRQTDALKQTIHRLRAALGPVEGRRIRSTPDGYELLA